MMPHQPYGFHNCPNSVFFSHCQRGDQQILKTTKCQLKSLVSLPWSSAVWSFILDMSRILDWNDQSLNRSKDFLRLSLNWFLGSKHPLKRYLEQWRVCLSLKKYGSISSIHKKRLRTAAMMNYQWVPHGSGRQRPSGHRLAWWQCQKMILGNYVDYVVIYIMSYHPRQYGQIDIAK